ncbi:MAG: hypothetical protein ACI9KE_003214 [Polyangiales bacterium]|jgi:hypothetical protein
MAHVIGSLSLKTGHVGESGCFWHSVSLCWLIESSTCAPRALATHAGLKCLKSLVFWERELRRRGAVLRACAFFSSSLSSILRRLAPKTSTWRRLFATPRMNVYVPDACCARRGVRSDSRSAMDELRALRREPAWRRSSSPWRRREGCVFPSSRSHAILELGAWDRHTRHQQHRRHPRCGSACASRHRPPSTSPSSFACGRVGVNSFAAAFNERSTSTPAPSTLSLCAMWSRRKDRWGLSKESLHASESALSTSGVVRIQSLRTG